MHQQRHSSSLLDIIWAQSWKLLPVLSVLVYGSHAILLNLCKDEEGRIPFNSAAVVLLIELTKLLISLALWLPELFAQRRSHHGRAPLRVLSLRSSWVFAIPAMLYTLNNNLVVYIQHYMDPASFQVLSNLKIASTAILYRVFLKNRLSTNQWAAIGLLLLGTISNSFGGIQSKSSGGQTPDGVYITLPGLLLLLVYCLVSGMSGIYTEYIFKKQKQAALSQQNVFLYIYGIAFNLLGYCLTTSSLTTSTLDGLGFFQGFSPWTLVIIFSQAINGLAMSYLMKHRNNIVRLFIIATAMLVTTVMSLLVFSLQLNLYFYSALILVCVALWLYYKR